MEEYNKIQKKCALHIIKQGKMIYFRRYCGMNRLEFTDDIHKAALFIDNSLAMCTAVQSILAITGDVLLPIKAE